MKGEYREETIIQNLKDSGCSSEIIESFVADLRTKKYSDGMNLLAAHRRRLLEELHREQRQIDCLDYLVYRIKKENLI